MMSTVAGYPPFFHLVPVKMHRKEVFKVHIREKKVGNVVGFIAIVVHVGIVIA